MELWEMLAQFSACAAEVVANAHAHVDAGAAQAAADAAVNSPVEGVEAEILRITDKMKSDSAAWEENKRVTQEMLRELNQLIYRERCLEAQILKLLGRG